MGTRGLLGLILRGKRHAAYNHWDSYPTGLGKDIVAFILSLSDEDIATMIRNIGEITWVDEKTKASPELQEHYSALGFSDTAVSTGDMSDWYCLLRNTQGASMLPAIKSGELKHAIDGVDFLNDELFCEWAYFIDFEEKKLEVWKGSGYGLVEEVTFEQLGKEDGFMARMESDGREEEEDED